jgi:hypothetical protein
LQPSRLRWGVYEVSATAASLQLTHFISL